MALRLHWVPILPLTFSTDKRSPSLTLQHKPSSSSQKPLSVSSLFFSNSSISTVSAIPSRKSRNLAQISSSVEEQQSNSSTITEEYEEPRTKLLAQNIPWTYSSQDIRKLFEEYGTVLNVELSMHNGTRNRGLAFVTMGSEEEATAAMTNLDSYVVEGRAIKILYSFKRKKQEATRPGYQMDSKLKVFVDNLNWDVTTEDLKEFLSSANVVSAEVILQRTEPRRSSGYGFVSFASRKEAAAAISNFKGKLLKGRPIRMELSGRTPKGKGQETFEEPVET